MDAETNEPMPEETAAPMTEEEEERADAEFSYVVGRITTHAVLDADGNVVVKAHTEVTTAHAVAAVAAGVLEDLALAVGAGEHARLEPHALENVTETE